MISNNVLKSSLLIFSLLVSILYISFLIMFIYGNILGKQYYLLFLSSVLSLVIVFLVFYLIYIKNKKCLDAKLSTYEQIRNIENELFTNINNNLELIFSKGIQDE